jgi:PAS domain S-box-containing protein
MSEDVTTSLRTAWTTTSIEESTLLRKLREQRFESEQLRVLGSAVRVAGEGIAILTPAVEALGPRIAFVNDGFCAIYGREREEIIGETPVAFGIVDRHHAIFDSMLQSVFARKAFAAEATAVKKNGREFELDLQLVPVEDGGELTHWVAFLRDVTDSRNEIVALRHQAMHDGLTDLPNRMMLFDRLAGALEAARSENRLVALLLMDLDRFKDVNDTFGHHFGDVLSASATSCSRTTPWPASAATSSPSC